MPLLTRTYLRAALASLALALLVGLLQALSGAIHLPAIFAYLGPVYFHLFLVGWVTQLIFGVVYWMFPKASRERPRGSPALGWATFILLNGGLLLRVFAEPLNARAPAPTWGALLVVSALAQWLAGVLFVLNTWTRVKER